MNKIEIIIIICIILIILGIFLKIESTNSFISELIMPIPHINYDKFKMEYPIINKSIPIYIFYHICPSNINIVYDQINILIESNLYNIAKKIYYGCNCNNCDTILNKLFKKYNKFIKMDSAILPNTKTYENETINAMINIAKSSNEKFYALYFHTKGTSNIDKSQHKWRKLMTNILINNYRICTDILDRGFHTVGILYNNVWIKHYSGNFFWVTSDYLKNVPLIEDVNDRMNAEYILFKNYIPNKHISISKKNYISFFISMFGITYKNGLYSFSTDMIDLNDLDICIV
jgi:hypothetical protein